MTTIISILFVISLPIFFLFVFYKIGDTIEKKHYASIKSREMATLNIPVVTGKKVAEDEKIIEAKLVSGSVVVSVDNFKRFMAGLINLVGGRVTVYESLMDRARREAILRMKEEAGSCDMIINTRLETMTISNTTNKSTGTVELLAYGTAIKLQR
jgi:uncharacterized protein YbjQ (UPF0145 family)